MLEQKSIAKIMFLEEKNIDILIKDHPEFKLTKSFLKRFWRSLYTSEQIKQRGFRIISQHHRTFDITKQDLENLYSNQLLLDEEIAKIYNTLPANISFLRKQYGIKTLENWQRHYTKIMTSEQKSIILGMILGDGYMSKGKNSQYACIGTHHSVIQKEYIKWLFSSLNEWVPSNSIKYKKESTHKVSGKIYESYYFESVHHPIFEELYQLFYANKIKIINKDYVLNHLDSLSIAVWIMDDGSCDKNSGSMRIYTNSFTEEDVLFLIDVFKNKFNINAKIIRITNKKTNKIYPIIKFNKQEAFELAKLIEPHIIPSMRYKIDPIFLKNNVDINNPSSLVVGGKINISKDKWKQLNFDHDKEYIKYLIIDSIDKYSISFPYKDIGLNSIKQDFENLLNIQTDSLLRHSPFEFRLQYKYNKSNEYIEQSKTGNICSDYFQQRNRFECSSQGHDSPGDIWRDKKKLNKLLDYLWTMKREVVNDDVFRGALRLRGYTASQFKPSVAKYIYNTYGNSGDVLDFSAGWGDRLAGFYASNCKSYTGIDPNKAVYDKYFEQEKFYKSIISDKTCEFINAPAEDVDLGDKTFDLAFTSPPYFDRERYSNNINQSWIRYKDLDDWLNKFLFKTIKHSWNHLKPNGYMIVNIADIVIHKNRFNLCDPMNDFISKLPNAKYEGAIGMKMSKRPNNKLDKKGIFAEPIWIWKKSNNF